MPSIKDFENKNKGNDDGLDLKAGAKKSKSPRRRPGRDESEANEPEVAQQELAAENTEAPAETATEAAAAFDSFNPPHLEADHETLRAMEEEPAVGTAQGDGAAESPFKKIHVNILGRELLTLETPQRLVDIADTVVKDWKNDGPFDDVPVGNPLAQMLTARGLRKAKDIEKKLEEKGVFAMAQMGLSVIKSKLKKD